jgi:hypothetical protein
MSWLPLFFELQRIIEASAAMVLLTIIFEQARLHMETG